MASSSKTTESSKRRPVLGAVLLALGFVCVCPSLLFLLGSLLVGELWVGALVSAPGIIIGVLLYRAGRRNRPHKTKAITESKLVASATPLEAEESKSKAAAPKIPAAPVITIKPTDESKPATQIVPTASPAKTSLPVPESLSPSFALYEKLCDSYKLYKDTPNSRKKQDYGRAVMSLISSCDTGVSTLIFNNAKKESSYVYHSILGCLFKAEPLAEIAERTQKELNRLSFLLRKSDEFAAEIASIPMHDIQIDTSAILHRQALGEMPEIKYTPVGQKFSFDKLPAFVVIDTETTGLKVNSGRIIEISAVLYEDLIPVSAFSTLINPLKPIPSDATEINGITDSMVENAPSLAQVAPAFLSFLSKYPIVGYNLPFDLKFLWASGIDFTKEKHKYYDVLDLCRKVFKSETNSFTLKNVCDICNIYRLDGHRSLSDCVATAKVFKEAVEYL